MKKNKLKITALVASSVLAIQATNLLSSSLSAKAMPLRMSGGSGNLGSKVKRTLTSSGLVTGSLIGIIGLSAAGIGLSAASIINNKHNDRMEQNRNPQNEKDKNTENQKDGFTPGIIMTTTN